MLKTFVSGIKMYLDRVVTQLRDEVGWKSEESTELFNETVTTKTEKAGTRAKLSYAELITAPVIVVTLDGKRYVCPKSNDGNYGGAEFPFTIRTLNLGSDGVENYIYTALGTHTVSASIETVTTTDTFKKAVNDIAGWKTTSEATLFDESVTTAGNTHEARLSYTGQLTADTLKVTFDGVEYTCPKISKGGFAAYGGLGQTGPDFTEFPFLITGSGSTNVIYTETAGTFTVSAVGDGTVYTDEFQKAVKSLSGAVEVSDINDADVVVFSINSDITVSNIRELYMPFTDSSDTTSDDIAVRMASYTLSAGVYCLYRYQEDVFMGEMSHAVKTRSGWSFFKHSVNTSLALEYVFTPLVEFRLTDYSVKFYSLGIPHTIDVDVSQ